MKNWHLKHWHKYFSVLIAVISSCAVLPNIASAQQSQNNAQNTKRIYDRAAGQTPSKLPVPRFVSFKYNTINGRSGPDEAYPVKFVYHKQGLPVKVIAETEDWRKIQDPDGTIVWVHKRVLDAKRTLITRQNSIDPILLRSKPNENGKIIATLSSGVICEIEDETPGWRQVKIGRYKGWLRAVEAYGS